MIRRIAFLMMLSGLWSGAYSQPYEIKLGQSNLTKLLDIFLESTLKKYDSLNIHDRKKGIISIEVYSINKEFFPMGIFPLIDTVDNSAIRANQLELRVSMILNESLFYVNPPVAFSIYNNRPVVFFTGLERFIVRARKSFLKKFRSYLMYDNYIIFSWIVKIDDTDNTIEILSKGVY